MTYQDIINLAAAGFTKNDIASILQVQPQVPPQQASPQQVPPQQASPQQVAPQQASPQQVPPQQASPQQVQPQQTSPQQVQPQPTQTEADMLAIIQRINATQAGLDIPPARTSSDILSDQLLEMFDSNKNSQNITPTPDRKGK